MTVHTDDKGVAELHIDNVDHATVDAHLHNEEQHQETVRQALTRHPRTTIWLIYAIWVILITSFDNQVGGVVIGIPEFRKDFGSPFEGDYVLPAKWQSAYSGGPTASSIVGSIGAGYLGDKIGRKYMYLVTFVVVLVGITVETVAKTNPVFFAGKFINGFAVGSFITTSMTYIGEIAPLALRGIMTAAAAISFTIGPFVVALIVNTYGVLQNQWAYRGIFVAQYGITAIGLLALPFMPESPWWCLSHNKEDAAANSFRKLGQSPEETEKSMANVKLTLEKVRQETEGVTYLECFRRSNLRRTMVAISPLSIQALCGVFFVAAYTTYYFQLAGYTAQESFKLGIAQQVLSMIGNICSWFLIDRVGRRNLSVYGLFALTVLLLVLGGLAVKTSDPGCVRGTVALMLFYCFLYNLTIGATAYTALTEIATARLRAKTASIGLALQNALFTMWAFTIPYIFNPDQANLGAKTAFIFGALSVFCTIYLFFCHPETAGRSYAEIDEMFIKRVPARHFKAFQTEAEVEGKEVHRRVSMEQSSLT